MNPLSYPAPEWRYADLIDGLKPYHNIVEMLEAKGYPRLPLSSIAGWRMRNSIPPAWVPALIGLGVDAGLIRTIEDLRIRPAEDNQPENDNEQTEARHLRHAV